MEALAAGLALGTLCTTALLAAGVFSPAGACTLIAVAVLAWLLLRRRPPRLELQRSSSEE
jgi:hypothetical protein